tara:strand:- start:140 stop:781 length:642 start_codon:yes stop_codon:yes gene_type:complete
MPFDNKIKSSTKNFVKSDFDLPENSFVLAAFHKILKITPKEIDSWSRILKLITNSIIWISDIKEPSKSNLIKQFTKRGISSNKIYFAKRIDPMEDHLARHSCADLLLDTFNYNGHSTVIDSLWSGLPVITLLGSGFSARNSASLLTTLNLTELIANDIPQYEKIIINLANDREKLTSIKEKLRKSKFNSTLFDSEKYTIDLENLLAKLIHTLN